MRSVVYEYEISARREASKESLFQEEKKSTGKQNLEACLGLSAGSVGGSFK